MRNALSDQALDQLFRQARTYHSWLPQPVSDELLHQLYDLMKWGPTSANLAPARFVFLRTREGKERLRPALSPGNVDQTMKAPVTVIVAHDERFYEKALVLSPHNPKMRDVFAGSPAMAESTAFRNGSLQGAYLILGARSLGLDCGPMSGFDNAKVDELFFPAAPAPAGRWRSNFLCNLGYGDPAGLYPRGPRLEFEDVCRLL